MSEQQALTERWQSIISELAVANVQLLAVSKYAPDDAVEVLIKAGESNFGESRPQNLRDRATRWPDCQWHMIGPLQKNKAKYIGRFAAMWHSCDNIETAQAVARHVEDRVLPVLIQVNISDNPDQSGIKPEDLSVFAAELSRIDGLRLVGLMGMAPQQGDVRSAFRALRSLRDQLFNGSFGELCMGMSNDYRIAIEEGATIVRLGSTLFDSRT
ncbi:MAG: YggS family pyridoxal phosphate-dependent enzyme [Zetaproteobacteria bacterium CG_4_9_14_3_um_filter_53_7]|nr:MAG: YggS family pyridoxal phosphate-dependent enzyme [Zetaproteobacteria bacterium CG_4_9_14_3_um_filter_53_7]